ncbi:MAG: recombinase family protein [Planctomycetota bacterium]|jgi:site-specific DNA recombinase
MTRRTQEPDPPRVRCAIYTRKSTEEGLDSDFNSLDAQRESAEAYVASQRHEGWVALPDRYDDGGFSGGSIERPALQKLLADVEAGLVDCIVVYKVDRLSRSLIDFVKIVEVFDRKNVSFVSVTQQFNTTTSMGRLTLNILLSFAQFEREVIGERIRDKMAAAKRRGKYTGGPPVFGYDVDRANKRLVVNEEEAKRVRQIFKRFVDLGSATVLLKDLDARGWRTKTWVTLKGKRREGRPWDKGSLYRLLNNRLYIGEVTHKGESYPGEHDAIVPIQLWKRVHEILALNWRTRANRARGKTPALLRGIIRCGACDCSMGPTYTRKGGKQYRYYLCVKASKKNYGTCPIRTVSARTVEGAVFAQLKAIFRTPELIARTYRAAKEQEGAEVERMSARKAELEAEIADLKAQATALVQSGGNGKGSRRRITVEVASVNREIERAEDELQTVSAGVANLSEPLTEREVIDALKDIDPVWNELFPLEQERIVQLLVERVEDRTQD